MTTTSTDQERTEQQEAINFHAMLLTLDQTKDIIRSLAAKEHAAYPQYEGHWDTWRLARITNRVRTKLGTAFEPGDIVLAAPENRPIWAGSITYRSCYSVRNGIDTAVPYGSFTYIEEGE